MKQLKICLSALALAFFMTACQQDTLEGVDYLNANENLEERAFCLTPPASEITFSNSGAPVYQYVYVFDYDDVVHQIRWRVKPSSGSITLWKTLKSTMRHYEKLPYMECTEYEVQMRVRCASGPNAWSAWSQTATKITGSSASPNPC